MKNLLNVLTNEELKKELENRGFYTRNLWHIEDVKSIFNVSDNGALDVLDSSLTNDATMEQIWFSIREFGEILGHKEK